MTATTLILCAYRGVSLPTHHAILQLMRQHPDWDELVVEQTPINRARSFAASQWYRDKPDEDVFLMVDDDILFETESAVQLVDRCRNGYDVIGGVYPFRDGSGVAVRTLPGDTSLSFGPGAVPQQVRHIGTGFLAVNRRILEAMIPTLPECSTRGMDTAFWPFFEDRIIEDEGTVAGHNWLTEDYLFCETARALGFKVWVDRSIFLAHYGQVPVTIDNRHAVHKTIAGVFNRGVPAEDSSLLAKNLEAAREKLAEEWQARDPKTSDEIAEFYRTSEHMVDDLTAWHATPERQQWTATVVDVARQIKANLAVDIGAGAGHELRALKAAGVETVVGVEPNDRMRQALEVDHIACHSSIGSARQVLADADLLICLDVLEHVPDPENFLGEIVGRAKHGAVLIESTATFDEGTPLHLKANRGWSPLPMLAGYGWELLTAANRVRIWQRLSEGLVPGST